MPKLVTLRTLSILERKKEKEITSIGAAIAAGLHVGVWKSIEEVRAKIEVDVTFQP